MKLVLLLLVVIASAAGWFLLHRPHTGQKCTENNRQLIEPNFELSNKILITADSGIVVSANSGDFFTLYKLRNNKIDVVNPSDTNVFSPFIFLSKLYGLQDNAGDENFKPTTDAFKTIVGDSAIESIYSFNNGLSVIYQLKNDTKVYFLNAFTGVKKFLTQVKYKLHGCGVSKYGEIVVMSYDDELVYIRKGGNTATHIRNLPPGEKLNAFIDGHLVYFVSNFESEFYQIYRYDIDNPLETVHVVYKSRHDLRMPKTNGGKLYFIEVVNSLYLLKVLDPQTGSVERITEEGVVYNYEFYGGEDITFTYSDLFTPASLMLYKASDKTVANLTGNRLDHGVSSKLVVRNNHSFAYVIDQLSNTRKKGVILFFHPGLHSDFSPRWDHTLINLSLNGYIIVAPNYPMSSGYGKTHLQADISKAIADLADWKAYCLGKFDLPLYYLSASSGNVLLEGLLSENSKNVAGAASLFGTFYGSSILSVPTLYVLGENDPIVDFEDRANFLRSAKSIGPISIVSYPDEGHWLRKANNKRDVVDKLIRHFCKSQP